MRMLIRGLVAALAALLLLTGCSERGEDGGAGSGEEETSLPSGLQAVTAERSGLRLGIPEDWEVLRPEALENPDSQAALEDFASRAGIPFEQLEQQLTQVDLLAASTSAAENINVLPLGGVSTLPGRDDLERDLGTMGATVTGVEDVETEVGTARVATYRLATGAGEQHGSSLFVVVDDSVVNLTSTAGSADRAAELTDQVAETLTAAE